MRVIEVERIEYIETIAMQQRQGLIANDKISAKQWESIRTHEEWLVEADAESS